MALHLTPEDHDANPPESWVVVKVADRRWDLRMAGADYPVDTFTTRTAAEEAKVSGSAARLYAEETVWFNGGQVAKWKPSPWPVRPAGGN